MKKKMGKIRIAIQLGAGALLVAGGLSNLPVTLLIILVSTVLAGPFFCGWICPFGTLQDIVSKLTKGIKKRKMPKGLQKALAFSRYILMAVTTLLTADFVFTILQYDARINFLSILDGKILTIGAYIILSIYLIIGVFFERPFCNYMCPQGAKYGLMGTLRPFRIVRDSQLCVDCGKCNKVCPMNIDIMNHNNVKSLQCINCMSCVSACPKQGALKFGILKLNRKSAAAYFLAVAVILATSTVAMALQFTANQVAEQAAKEAAVAALQTESSNTVSSKTTNQAVEASVTTAETATQTTNSSTTSTATSNQSAPIKSVTASSGGTKKSSTSTKSNTTTASSSTTTTQNTNANSATTTTTPNTATAQVTSTTQASVVTPTGDGAGIADGTYTGEGQGFRGPMTVAVTVKNQQITNIEVLSNSDDRKWFNRALNSIPDWIIQAQSTNVDTVSGATYSSRGIISAAKDALSKAK